MKKSLFALAAVGAFAGAAQAQSSVTVYGILDVGYIGSNTRGSTDGTSTKMNQNSFATGAESSSRIGFRGNEDLGGGMRAFFTIEQDINVNSTSQSITNNRQSFVGLGQKGMGQIAFGMQNTIIHQQVGATSAGQQNNMPGDVIYPVSSNTTANAASGNGSGIAYTVRTQNTFQFQTDRFAGVRVTGLYSLNYQDKTQTASGLSAASTSAGGNTNTSAWGLGVDYTWNKLLAAVSYQSLKNETSNTVADASATTIAGLVNATSNQFYAGATYDFGILKAYINYINRKDINQLNTSEYLQRSAQQIGVRGFVTKTVEGWAMIGNGAYKAYGTSNPTANFTGYQLGSNYWLSKRTNLYAIFGSTQTSGSSGTATTLGPSVGSNAYALGVRHTF